MMDTPTDTAPQRFPGKRTRLLILAATSAIAACAGGGPQVEGPQAHALFEDYSATWVLDTMVSDPVPEMSELYPAPGGPFGGGGPTGGRARPGMGGRPGGGMPPPGGMVGGKGGRRGGIDRRAMETIRHMTSVARQRPTRITLTLDDSLFAVHASPGGRVVVPTSGEKIALPDASWPTQAKVEWDGLQPRLERNFEAAGRILDHFEVVGRTRLILTRVVEIGRMDDVRMVFAYDREGSPGGERE